MEKDVIKRDERIKIIAYDKKHIDYMAIYYKALTKSHSNYLKNKNKEDLYKVVYYGVKYVNTVTDIDKKDLPFITKVCTSIVMLKDYIKLLMPTELMRIFPIEKIYDGEKYQCKDYFFTMRVLKKHGLSNIIGESIHDILWAYVSLNLAEFTIQSWVTAGRLHTLQTGSDFTTYNNKPKQSHLKLI